MQQSFSTFFKKMPATSRVWTYLCNRSLSPSETEDLQSHIDAFTLSWKAHQRPLSAQGKILFNRYIVLVVDESFEAISGCSIDSSVHFVKMIESKLGVEFFNRLNVLVSEENQHKIVSYHDLESLKGAHVFNPRIETLKELRESWLVEIKEAPFF